MALAGSWTAESWAKVEREVYERCVEVLDGRPSLIRSADPRLQGQAGCTYDVKMNRASLPALLLARERRLLVELAQTDGWIGVFWSVLRGAYRAVVHVLLGSRG